MLGRERVLKKQGVTKLLPGLVFESQVPRLTPCLPPAEASLL